MSLAPLLRCGDGTFVGHVCVRLAASEAHGGPYWEGQNVKSQRLVYDMLGCLQ
jgi:hypothetical protein